MKIERSRVIITGGTGGLGRTVMMHFRKEGAAVSVLYRTPGEPERLEPGDRAGIRFVRADLTREEDVRSAFAEIVQHGGKPEILLNLAGGYAPARPVGETTVQDFDGMLSVNLRTMFLCSREFLRNADLTRPGRIVSVAAMTALRPGAGKAAYAVSKAGVVTLTAVLGDELKGTPLTANAIAPGIIDTPANRDSMPDADRTAWVTTDAIAKTILFLCSDAANGINGTTLPLFGGL